MLRITSSAAPKACTAPWFSTSKTVGENQEPRILRGDDRRDAFGLEILENGNQPAKTSAVEPDFRLVEDDDLRLAVHRPGKGHGAPLAKCQPAALRTNRRIVG